MTYTLIIKGEEPYVSDDFADCMNKVMAHYAGIDVHFYLRKNGGKVSVDALSHGTTLLGRIEFDLDCL